MDSPVKKFSWLMLKDLDCTMPAAYSNVSYLIPGNRCGCAFSTGCMCFLNTSRDFCCPVC